MDRRPPLLRRSDRQDAERRGRRGDRVVELGKHDIHRVQIPPRESLHQRFYEFGGVLQCGAIADVDALRCWLALGKLEVADAFFAYEVQLCVDVLPLELLEPPPRLSNQVRIERAAQPALRGDQQQRRPSHPRAPSRVAGLAQQRESLGELGRVELADHLRQRLGVGTRAHHAVLRALELRRGYELHRLRDLAGVLHRADSPLQLAGLRHYSALYSSIALRRRALKSSDSARLVRISSTISGCCAAMNSSSPFSHSLIWGTFTSSIRPFVTAKITTTCCSTGIG